MGTESRSQIICHLCHPFLALFLHSSSWLFHKMVQHESCPYHDGLLQQGSCSSTAGSPAGLCMDCVSFSLQPLLPCGLLHNCMWRRALCSDCRLQGRVSPPQASPGLQEALLRAYSSFFCSDLEGWRAALSHLHTYLSLF